MSLPPLDHMLCISTGFILRTRDVLSPNRISPNQNFRFKSPLLWKCNLLAYVTTTHPDDTDKTLLLLSWTCGRRAAVMLNSMPRGASTFPLSFSHLLFPAPLTRLANPTPASTSVAFLPIRREEAVLDFSWGFILSNLIERWRQSAAAARKLRLGNAVRLIHSHVHTRRSTDSMAH